MNTPSQTRLVMVDFYKILKVSPQASLAEIKSAYRRLARKLHPDLNGGSKKAGEEFALIAEAYEILHNPRDRARFDAQLSRSSGLSHGADSVFYSDNPHAQKLRQMAIELRYNEIVDQMIAEERKETLALQKVVFLTVALFVTTCFTGIFKPTFWANSGVIGRIILLTIFVVSGLHLFRSLHTGFEKYTYDHENLHDSILDTSVPVSKPYSRVAAIAFLTFGIAVSLGIGLLIGNYAEISTASGSSHNSLPMLRLEFVFYPPIVALVVDIVHNVALKLE